MEYFKKVWNFNMKGTKFISAILVSLVYASLLLGCGGSEPDPADQQAAAPAAEGQKEQLTAPSPVAAYPQAYSQLVVQAGEHWRDLASDIGARVLKAYEDRSDLLDRPLYLPPPNNRPFTVAFYHLLRTELVSRGLQVSYYKEPRSVVLEYSVQTVPFDPSRRSEPGRFENEAASSDSEVIVSARMFYRNRFVMHASSVRYINEADLALYLDPQSFDPLASSSRSIRIDKK